MTPQIPKDDSNFEWDTEELLDAYREAAEYDDFLFGDHDYSYVWMEKEKNQKGL